MTLSSKTYDILKFILMKLLPGLGAAYFALCTLFNLPYGEQVVGVITIIQTFLSGLISESSEKYYMSMTPKQ